jgi:hypothetical protein
MFLVEEHQPQLAAIRALDDVANAVEQRLVSSE